MHGIRMVGGDNLFFGLDTNSKALTNVLRKAPVHPDTAAINHRSQTL